MKGKDKRLRPIWLDKSGNTVKIIDQRQLPHSFVVRELRTADDVIFAIEEMLVRGAPLIGVTGAYGVYLSLVNPAGESIEDRCLVETCRKIGTARPTAVNLGWAVDRVLKKVLEAGGKKERIRAARVEAAAIAEEEAAKSKKIGENGLKLIQEICRKKGKGPVNLLTHCNAGWLACIEYGTATAPIYEAFDAGIDIHVWVDETRPLNQGARLTAWELGKYGVRHTVIADNAGGHLMQHGLVDMVIVGSDRTTATGDVANKIGTYLKALAARDNDIPFYVALPSSTIDWRLRDGIGQIPIEERDPDEQRYVTGRSEERVIRVLVPPESSPAANFAFDVTPARLITGLITERGVCQATEAAIRNLFPEMVISKDAE